MSRFMLALKNIVIYFKRRTAHPKLFQLLEHRFFKLFSNLKSELCRRSADKVEERLEEVRAILRKYGGGYDTLQSFYANAKNEYASKASSSPLSTLTRSISSI